MTEPLAKIAASLGRALQAEPLFHMSLGSKELFHSNVIAWFASKYPYAAGAVLGPWAGKESSSTRHRISREKRHLDLLIELPQHRPLVIENKVFSMPDEQQLERYAEASCSELEGPLSLVLLSLAQPGWQDGRYRGVHGTWRHFGYEELREGLVESIGAVTQSDQYDGDTLHHYCELVRLLLELRNLVGIQDEREQIALPPCVSAGLEPARVADHAQKFRMHQIGARLRTRLAAEGEGATVKCEFTSGGPLIEAFVPLTGDDKIGWQFQSGQFRLVLVLESHAGRGADAKERRAKRARAQEEWFDFSQFHAVMGTTDANTIPKGVRTAPGDFCHYDPNFVYRYRKPPAMTVCQLLDLGTRYLRAAREGSVGGARADLDGPRNTSPAVVVVQLSDPRTSDSNRRNSSSSADPFQWLTNRHTTCRFPTA